MKNNFWKNLNFWPESWVIPFGKMHFLALKGLIDLYLKNRCFYVENMQTVFMNILNEK